MASYGDVIYSQVAGNMIKMKKKIMQSTPIKFMMKFGLKSLGLNEHNAL